VIDVINIAFELLKTLLLLLRTRLMSRMAKDFEILALRSQLSIVEQQIINKKIPKVKVSPAFRLLWVFISKHFDGWKSHLVIVKPETVIKWHRKAFKLYWKRKSKPKTRCISNQTIALIKRVHKENPLLSPEKIHEQLCNLNISDAPAPNTIAKYIKNIRKTPTDKQRQSWKTFLKNHRKGLWAMDMFVVPTICFKVLYVLILVSHDRREIKHFAVTTNPYSSWVIQQVREATPFDESPEYLLHDNDCVFVSKHFQGFLSNANIKSVRTAYHSPWQNGICERTVGIIRTELLNNIIPRNEDHLHRLLKEYIKYYNKHRTHQGIDCQTPILSETPKISAIKDTELEATPILNGLYHTYKKIA